MSRKPLMTRAKKLTRRAFIVSSALVAGGAAFGIYTAKRELPNPLGEDFSAALNPFVVIGEEITLIVPRAEMGQGVSTTLAALIAEELDVDWEQIRVIHGPAAQAYYNGAIIEGSFPVPSWKRSGWVNTVAEATEVIPKALGLQVTGGSSSTRDGFTRMRAAGAAARIALLQAAAEREGSPDGLTTRGGAVIRADGTALPYADLAERAAQMDIGEITLRPARDWRLLGRSLPRTDMVAKVTGTARFGLDTRLEGMRFATLRQPPEFGTTLEDLDPAPALAISGVEAVHRIGDGFAVVAAHTWAALQGAEALSPVWTKGKALDDEQIWAALETALDGSANLTVSPSTAEPVAGQAPDATATSVSADYRLPYLAHATMEPMNATAWLQGDRLEIWAGVQGPMRAQAVAKTASGAREVRIHTTYLGGGFGRRIESDYVRAAAELAAKMPEVPVQLMWSREEDMTQDAYRPAALARASATVRRASDGTARATETSIQLAAQSVTRAAAGRMLGLPLGIGPDHAHLDGIANQPYALGDFSVSGYLVDLPVPVGFWRSVGHSIGAFVMESFIDELAAAGGVDPLAFRLAHMVDPASKAVLEACAARFGWATRAQGAPKTKGQGVAFCHSFGTPVAQMIEVENRDGRIALTRAVIACDPGIALDPSIIEAQMSGAMIYGLSAAIHGAITLQGGSVVEQNFPDYEAVRMESCPPIEVEILTSRDTPQGVGEPGTPPAAPALANAIFDLTGQRFRSLPLSQHLDFL